MPDAAASTLLSKPLWPFVRETMRRRGVSVFGAFRLHDRDARARLLRNARPIPRGPRAHSRARRARRITTATANSPDGSEPPGAPGARPRADLSLDREAVVA
jgi:hypothetical protein